jgi:hypothetical protein
VKKAKKGMRNSRDNAGCDTSCWIFFSKRQGEHGRSKSRAVFTNNELYIWGKLQPCLLKSQKNASSTLFNSSSIRNWQIKNQPYSSLKKASPNGWLNHPCKSVFLLLFS